MAFESSGVSFKSDGWRQVLDDLTGRSTRAAGDSKTPNPIRIL
jgi:hypothetical protein